MTRSKLSDANKQAIIQLFCESDSTIADLARQYEVSSSTIRRLLKRQLLDSEYEALVAAKSGKQSLSAKRSSPSSEPEASSPAPPILKSKTARQSPQAETESTSSVAEPELEELLAEIEQDLGEDRTQNEADLETDDDDEATFDEEGGEDESESISLQPESVVEISPLTEAVIPQPCYLVVDHTAELITRPLQEFGDLGHIPKAESQSKTLPIFENHRVARRFSQRSQRVIKVPSGDLLQKTGTHLSAKGITRLLINGRVYTL
ncbi:MAG: transposase [Cyanobacteria bacterium P01_A01_bin.17]